MSAVDQKVFDSVKEIFEDTFVDSDYDFSMELESEDIEEWDSLTHIRLLTALESEFDIQFDIDEIEQLSSVAIIVSMIQQKQ